LLGVVAPPGSRYAAREPLAESPLRLRRPRDEKNERCGDIWIRR
jgi:hypothetical protein